MSEQIFDALYTYNRLLDAFNTLNSILPNMDLQLLCNKINEYMIILKENGLDKYDVRASYLFEEAELIITP